MKKILFLFLFLALVFFFVMRPSKPKKIITFDNSFYLKPTLSESPPNITVEIKLEPGFHAYGAMEKTAISPTIEINKGSARLLGNPQLPNGKKQKISKNTYSFILEEKFTIKQRLSSTDFKEAFLFFQLCTDSLCDRPRKVKLQFQ